LTVKQSERAERVAGSDRFFGRRHPVADAAAMRCAGAAHQATQVGGVACGQCWERAIRDDERIAVLFELPREFTPDPSYVDAVAVQRACAGERVRLTQTERVAAVESLRRKAMTPWRISTLLRMPMAAANEVLADLAAGSGPASRFARRAATDVAAA
jgi:hypothetical protein